MYKCYDEISPGLIGEFSKRGIVVLRLVVTLKIHCNDVVARKTAYEQENESHVAVWSIDYMSWIVCFAKETPYVKT